MPLVNGLFLVRESTHFPGDYTLSICSDVAIEHYRIQKNERTRQLTIDDESYFDNLAELIAVGVRARYLVSLTDLTNHEPYLYCIAFDHLYSASHSIKPYRSAFSVIIS